MAKSDKQDGHLSQQNMKEEHVYPVITTLRVYSKRYTYPRLFKISMPSLKLLITSTLTKCVQREVD